MSCTTALLAAAAIALSASSSEAASLVPALVDSAGRYMGEGAAAEIQFANVYDGDVVRFADSDPWGLDGYRLALESANATMQASFSNDSITADSYVALSDPTSGDLYGPEGNPEFNKAWFRVMPDGEHNFGDFVDIHVGLAWDFYTTPGANEQTTAHAVLGSTTGCCVVPTLTRQHQNQTAQVMVGGLYYVGLWHSTFVSNGSLQSTATMYAGLTPPGTLTAPDPRLPGDYNLDGVVNAADYTVYRDAEGYDFMLDGDGSGTIDQGDYGVWADWFGSASLSVSAASVPEPSSAVALLIGTTILVSRSFRMRA